MSQILASYSHTQLQLRKHPNGRLQIVKLHPECYPSEYVLTPRDLNNEYHKIVHSQLVKKIKPYFQQEKKSGYQADFDCGYQNLPQELFDELVAHLQNWEEKKRNETQKLI